MAKWRNHRDRIIHFWSFTWRLKSPQLRSPLGKLDDHPSRLEEEAESYSRGWFQGNQRICSNQHRENRNFQLIPFFHNWIVVVYKKKHCCHSAQENLITSEQHTTPVRSQPWCRPWNASASGLKGDLEKNKTFLQCDWNHRGLIALPKKNDVSIHTLITTYLTYIIYTYVYIYIYYHISYDMICIFSYFVKHQKQFK